MDSDALRGTPAGTVLLERLFAGLHRARVLTLTRQGRLGCDTVNAVLAQRVAAVHTPGDRGVFSGAAIAIQRNDYGRRLFNGDVGIVLGTADGGYRAYFRHAGQTRVFAVDGLPEWEPAFATTVHKSQGAEFDDVLLVLPEAADHRLLSREIIYTAVTRARRRVVIYGQTAVLQAAVARRNLRQSGLRWPLDRVVADSL
jgi:exodeoxyribonuclease V alpha subunit